MKPPTEEDLRRRRELDARRADGEKAWSPSRAREALRAWRRGRDVSAMSYNECFKLAQSADTHDCLSDLASFDAFCEMRLGERLKI